LTRENLVLWKVPLDTRQGLPKATLDEVQKTWGFQDTEKIDPLALRALLSDYQNGEQANIRRTFGFTTLFQPKKPVTRAEAAMALSYFGYQGEGVTAKEASLVNSDR
ncbi:MAG: S-layer homology domain-containing protein, partial [Cyanobacteriota bacterium]|nr:S-layer homology domain-containing protein [Cyanobacteriota bacterium]